MSYRFDGSDAQGLYIDSALGITATPIWLVAGFTQEAELAELSTFPMIAVLGVAGSNNNRLSLNANDDAGLRATSRTTASVQAATSTVISGTAFHVGVANLISDTSRLVELDAAGQGTNTTSNAPTGFNRFAVGISPTLNALGHEGKIAYVAIGTGTLSAGDRALLGAGGDPRAVTSAVLVELWDFTQTDTPLVGLVAGNVLTAQGAPAFVNEAPSFSWLAGSLPSLFGGYAMQDIRRRADEPTAEEIYDAHFDRIYKGIK